MKIKDIDIFKLFEKLVEEPMGDVQYRVSTITEELPHKLGCSPENYPMFFVETKDNKMQNDIKMEFFKVLFNRKCELLNEEGNKEIKKYTIIQLNSRLPEQQRYFLEVVLLVLLKLNSAINSSSLREELVNVIELFSSSKEVPLEVIVGLWSELFVIDQSKDPSYLLTSWHVTPQEKYDFNDGDSKIEVKSTTGYKREHAFSLEQLHPNPHSDLIIASLLIQQSGIGESIMDLMERIFARVDNLELQYKLQDIVIKTLGTNWEEVSKMYFDYDYAKHSYRIYASEDIPSISIAAIPAQVSGVKFYSDLSGVEPLKSISKEHPLQMAL